MAYGEFRVLTKAEELICEENGIDPHGKSVVLAGEDFLLLVHHKTRDSIRINYGEARLRSRKDGKRK